MTEGEPDFWPILIISDAYRSFQQVRLSMTSFLADLFTGRLRPFFLIEGGIRLRSPAKFVPDSPSQLAPSGSAQDPATWRGCGTPGASTWPCEVEWFPPDSLGRPTGATANICEGKGPWPGFVPAAFTSYPDWWHELPKPLNRWTRAQLLGWRLGGPANDCFDNLVPLRPKTQADLWVYERIVPVRDLRGARLQYSVHANYQGTNRYPASLTLSYRSLDERQSTGYQDSWTMENL